MEVSNLPIGKLRVRSDARQVNEDTVSGLVTSIAEVGLINPIRVREITVFENGREAIGWEVVTGAHRYEAMSRLKMETIPSIIVEDDDLHAELAMIDENLMRAELSAADRARHTARRKAIYLELHPDTGHGGDRKSDQVAESATRSDSFVTETAKSSGRAARTVRADAERGKKIPVEVLEQIAGTHLDTAAYLDKIKDKTAEEQVAKVRRDLAQAERDREAEKAARRAAKIDAGVQVRAAQEVAEIIVEYVPADALAGLKINLEAAGKIKFILDALSNLTGKSIMDDRYGEAA